MLEVLKRLYQEWQPTFRKFLHKQLTDCVLYSYTYMLTISMNVCKYMNNIYIVSEAKMEIQFSWKIQFFKDYQHSKTKAFTCAPKPYKPCWFIFL